MIEFYERVHAWQPRWLQRLFYPLFEGLTGVLVVPLVGVVWLLRHWSPVPYVAAPIVVIIVSAVYEWREPAPKWTDHLWRTVGIDVVWWCLVLLWPRVFA